MSIITLTTDFGLKDHFVGALKGKILSEFIEAKIVDISHDIDPFNISETNYIIGASYANFPKGTVHIIGVDLEINIENQHIAIEWNNQFFICANNGILSLLTQKMLPKKMVSINIHNRFSVDATAIDVFVKVACHLAKGGLLNVIGKEIEYLKPITDLQPTISDDRKTLNGIVTYIDHYGNAVTNISKKTIEEHAKGRSFEINFKNKNIKTIFAKYSDIGNSGKYPLKHYEGQKMAVYNEASFLEIAIFRSNPATVGSANSLLGLSYRDVISIVFF
jgi:S-adenosylmethionine hydrolase